MEVANYYQEEAYRAICGCSEEQIAGTIAELKAADRERETAHTIKRLKAKEKRGNGAVPKNLAYVSGGLFDDYLHDMKIIQWFAVLNRRAMTAVILEGMGLTECDRFTTIHNCIDTDAMILRKGAVSAKAGERLLIPINMRDGSLICVGKGNDEWNQSAPHGAGRLMSRKEAFAVLSMDEYAAEMNGIFTTCVSRKTLDESPMAYKNMEEIVSHIEPTAEIVNRLLPEYNFKASE
jgi:RNA-splicing ligase RtcB